MPRLFAKGHVPAMTGKGRGYAWLAAHVSYAGDECLTWPFSRDGRVGRGRLGYMGKLYWAHRLMCELAHGPQPEERPEVAHSCGKGHEGCVNPRHLRWASQSENHLDRRRHGTAATNKHGSRTRLTLEQIAEIRRLKGLQTQVATAKQFGISLASVQRWQGSHRLPAPPGKSRRIAA